MHGEGTTGVGGAIRPSLRNGFTAYTYSPRGPGFLAPVARKRLAGACLANLTSASGGQDHTISPSARALVVLRKDCAQITRVHRIPLPTSVTIAKRPSCGGGTAKENH